jgi:histone H1/5
MSDEELTDVPEEKTEEVKEEKSKGKRKRSPAKSKAPEPKAKKAKASTEGKKKKKSPVTHPRTVDMVMEGIKAMGESKGSSVQAIRTWVLANYETVRPDMIKVMLRRGLQQGLDEGVLVRPKGQEEISAMSGRYRVAAGAKLPDSAPEHTTKRSAKIAFKKLSAASKGKRKKKGGKGKKKSAPSPSPAKPQVSARAAPKNRSAPAAKPAATTPKRKSRR